MVDTCPFETTLATIVELTLALDNLQLRTWALDNQGAVITLGERDVLVLRIKTLEPLRMFRLS